MPEIILRLVVLVCIGAVVWLLIWLSRRFIETQRQQALTAAPLGAFVTSDTPAGSMAGAGSSHVRILAFTSADCHRCHQLQAPALQRVAEARQDTVTVVAVDATTEHELVQAYHVLTVPSTVILDATGQTHAINYGFATTQRLLEQVDEALVKTTY